MENLDKSEKIKLLEEWKITLAGDIAEIKAEQDEFITERKKREEQLARVIAKWNKKVLSKQKLIDKVNQKIAKIDKEIQKIEDEDEDKA